ncbi:hypothetical protein HRE53_09595 [Acaryochloris sp. 'Moss Beach']|uniref:hypothetical protein n=1 Tax=Acaryochloris sp. 'Moss Beach' TaxID=2740837 RepID=UPI001F271223|nr:hypothetical protein [Acaryochloris sp. 'Moss Beach']UJB71221.1 hypothetical protein HRE53_09595 [Acaryochloris sp. 'Moss Beach']
MGSTFLLHKPVIYGSALANSLFLIVLLLHIIPAVMAPISAMVAFLARKGSKLHLRSGRFFAWSMATIALTGIALDIVRLGFFVEENHMKYAGYTMPATYPARLGFMFVGVCVLYMLREVTPPRIFGRQSREQAASVVPSLLVGTGLSLTAIITLRLNPWTGALWMIWTFILIVFVMAQPPSPSMNNREADVARHRFGMSCLAGYSWWGALQGFGPAIAILVNGDDLSTTAYMGNQPGPFSPAFFLFFISWAPFFVLAAYLIRRFQKLRQTGAKVESS